MNTPEQSFSVENNPFIIIQIKDPATGMSSSIEVLPQALGLSNVSSFMNYKSGLSMTSFLVDARKNKPASAIDVGIGPSDQMVTIYPTKKMQMATEAGRLLLCVPEQDPYNIYENIRALIGMRLRIMKLT